MSLEVFTRAEKSTEDLCIDAVQPVRGYNDLEPYGGYSLVGGTETSSLGIVMVQTHNLGMDTVQTYSLGMVTQLICSQVSLMRDQMKIFRLGELLTINSLVEIK